MKIPVEIVDGLDLKSLPPGSLVDLETKTRHYRIECLGGDAIRISGHPGYCPQPVPACFQGSVDKEGRLEPGLIEPGMRLIFMMNDDRPLRTSKVVHVQVDEPEAATVNSSHS